MDQMGEHVAGWAPPYPPTPHRPNLMAAWGKESLGREQMLVNNPEASTMKSCNILLNGEHKSMSKKPKS